MLDLNADGVITRNEFEQVLVCACLSHTAQDLCCPCIHSAGSFPFAHHFSLLVHGLSICGRPMSVALHPFLGLLIGEVPRKCIGHELGCEEHLHVWPKEFCNWSTFRSGSPQTEEKPPSLDVKLHCHASPIHVEGSSDCFQTSLVPIFPSTAYFASAQSTLKAA